MKNNVLYLECRGCYFWNDDPIRKNSDVGNYRVCTIEDIPHENGRYYFLEFTRYDRREIRTAHKITGKPLKHPITEITVKDALHVWSQFDDARGSWGDIKLENEIHNKKRTYTKENILKTVNEISTKKYNAVVMVSADEIIKKLDLIYNMGGYRERAILDDLIEVKTKEYNKNYWVFTFYDSSNNTFDFEYYSNRITG